MRFVVWTAGDRSIGVGHLTRSAAVGAALVRRGHEVRIFAGTDADLLPYASIGGVAATAVSGEAGAEALAPWLGPVPTVVVTDLPGLGRSDADRLRDLGAAAIVHLATDGLDRVTADLAIVDDLALPQTTAPAARRFVVGLEHHVVQPEVMGSRPSSPWSRPRADRVLVALGGADPGELTEPLVSALVRHDGLRVAAIAGPAWCRDRTERFVATAGDADVLVAPNGLAAAILAADVVVTLGGRTTFEAFATGRPTACLRWSHMARYVDDLVAAGLTHDLGSDPAGAADRLAELARCPAPLAESAARAFGVVDGAAADRVAALCESVTP